MVSTTVTDPSWGPARLFPDGGPATTLTLASAHAFDDGVVHLAHGE